MLFQCIHPAITLVIKHNEPLALELGKLLLVWNLGDDQWAKYHLTTVSPHYNIISCLYFNTIQLYYMYFLRQLVLTRKKIKDLLIFVPKKRILHTCTQSCIDWELRGGSVQIFTAYTFVPWVFMELEHQHANSARYDPCKIINTYPSFRITKWK